jgi:hypothetical protein
VSGPGGWTAASAPAGTRRGGSERGPSGQPSGLPGWDPAPAPALGNVVLGREER